MTIPSGLLTSTEICMHGVRIGSFIKLSIVSGYGHYVKAQQCVGKQPRHCVIAKRTVEPTQQHLTGRRVTKHIVAPSNNMPSYYYNNSSVMWCCVMLYCVVLARRRLVCKVAFCGGGGGIALLGFRNIALFRHACIFLYFPFSNSCLHVAFPADLSLSAVCQTISSPSRSAVWVQLEGFIVAKCLCLVEDIYT